MAKRGEVAAADPGVVSITIPPRAPSFCKINSVADPDPDAFFSPGSGIRNAEWVKNPDPNLGSGSGMNNPDHISESLETFFGVKILTFFDGIRDEKKFGSGISDKHPGSATLKINYWFLTMS
jgi:hypothetical protein